MSRVFFMVLITTILASCELVSSDETLDPGEAKTVTFQVLPREAPFCGTPDNCIVIRDFARIGSYAMELWLVDGNDEKLQQLTVLVDDGTGVDQAARDGIFTGAHTFQENNPGMLRLKAFETANAGLASDNVIEITVGEPVSLADALAVGGPAFEEKCSGCHLSDGSGIPGLGPALAGNEKVLGNLSETIEIIVHGNGLMPDHSDLTDDVLAGIVTYIRNSWSNNTGEVTQAGEIAAVR